MDRRHFLFVSGLAAGVAALPRMAFAATGGEKRFLFVLQRGAADGMQLLAPVGDRDFADLRRPFVEELEQGARLDGFFALNPAMPKVAALYQAKQALFVPAIASAYRDRSHFDGQNLLESGGAAPYAEKTGWLNRLVALLPPATKAIAIANSVPLALRGAAPAASYEPDNLKEPAGDLMERVGQLYADNDRLATAWAKAIETTDMAGQIQATGRNGGATVGTLVSRLMGGPSGARIMMLETGGWDTHSGQAGRSRQELGRMDAMIEALRTGLGPAWNDTLVLVATEFGRTARVNGTQGTDHGTASTAWLAGGALGAGALTGGRVLGDWPGLSSAALYQDRDLKPTGSLEALIAGATAAHFGLDAQQAQEALFPHLKGVTPMAGLVA